ncbi:zinc finger, CCHC-type containing protein [Tanacetum coccineum]
MGNANPIRTFGDYSKPSHEGYRNTFELPKGNNVAPLRSDTIQLGKNVPILFQFSLYDQASNWLKRLPTGSISTWEDLTTRFLAQFFLPGRTAKLRNDILMFQQHQGESLSEAWTRFKDFLQKVPHHGIDLWLQVQIFYDHVNPTTRRTINQSADGKLRDRNFKESWALLDDLVLYDNETYLAPKQPIQVNKITSSCEICSGPRDTQYCMENPEQAFVDYASSRTNEAGDCPTFEADFKQKQSEMTNKIDTVLKAITDRVTGALPSDTVKNLKLNVNSTSLILSARPYLKVDPQCSSHPSTSINDVKTCSTETNHSQKRQLQTMMGIETQQTKDTEQTLADEFKDLHLNLPVLKVRAQAPIYNAILDKYVESLELGKNGLGDSEPFDTLADLGACINIIPLYLFKKLNIGLLEETDHVFGLADGTNRKRIPSNRHAVIDCRKAKIAVEEGITRLVLGVKGVELSQEEAPYWTTLGERESYKP